MRDYVRAASAALIASTSLTLSGCNTDDALAQQRLEQLRSQEAGLKDLQAYLATNPNLNGPDTASLFLSAGAINSILASLDGITIPIAGVEGATATIRQVRTAFGYGYPLLTVSASATKAGLGATLDLTATATIEPQIDPARPNELSLRIRLDSIVPSAQWGIFDFQIQGFVKDLLQVKLDEKLRTLGVIKVPISRDFQITVPAKTIPVTFTGATGNLTTPAISFGATGSITRIITLPDGLHVYGKLSV